MISSGSNDHSHKYVSDNQEGERDTHTQVCCLDKEGMGGKSLEGREGAAAGVDEVNQTHLRTHGTAVDFLSKGVTERRKKGALE